MTIDSRHPYFFLKEIFSLDNAEFTFSRYVYMPDSLSDNREVIHVKGETIDEGWIADQFRSLAPDQELALHSIVKIKGRKFHIPMIDFFASRLSELDIHRLSLFIPRNVFISSAYFRTGRSYHAYSKRLLGPKKWMGFMGRLLLVNAPKAHQIIDSRWIGHRLVAGYGSLRLSNNSNRYKGLPEKVDIRALTDGPAMTSV